MPITGLDPDKCRQRNYVAARRGEVDAAPVRLATAEVPLPEGARLTEQFGRIPSSAEGALEQINRTRAGQAPLGPEDVFVHVLEAANDNFVPDRYMFLEDSTLRNIAKDADAGFAFMNSHRTGSLSTPSELPFGRTFAGRYEQYERLGGTGQRAIVAFYMLRRGADGQPVYPNGANGPSTADLHAMIEAGTLFDVSVGLYGGEKVCDVCGHGLNEYDVETGDYMCPHVPGTLIGMDPKQAKAQEKRGVPDGKASYSLVNARCAEVSGVYDGAVPGAGFRKALALHRAGRLSDAETLSCRGAYRTLLQKGTFAPARESREDLNAMLEAATALLGIGDLAELSDEKAPAAETFEKHLETVLATVRGCMDRAQEIHQQRFSENRSLSVARWEDLRRLREELGALIETTTPRVYLARRLQLAAAASVADTALIMLESKHHV